MLGLVLTLQLGGCALLTMPPQTAALQQQAPADLPRRAERSETPFFPQTPYHCGPAALATALGQVGLPADPQALGEAVFLPARDGSLQLEMLAAARRHGAVATRLPGELQALLREVAAGQVVVVLLNLGLDFAPRWHYAVLVGYDLDARVLVLRSGTTARELLPMHTFEHTWARAGHWAISVQPPGRWPLTATARQALDAAIGFERSAPPVQAALAYRSLLQRWPGQLLAGIGLGNALQAAGDLDGAAAAFAEMAAQQHSAVAWNNLARVRLAQGDPVRARTAAEQAVARASTAEPQWLGAARETLALALGATGR